MRIVRSSRVVALLTASLTATLGLQLAQPAAHAAPARSIASVPSTDPPPPGPAGVALQATAAGAPSRTTRQARRFAAADKVNASYTHSPAPDGSQNLPAGSGPIMPSTTLYYVFWLPTGLHYEADDAGDTNYENLLTRWAQDVGGSQYLNLVTQYTGTNGTVSNTFKYGGSWTDTAAYPHAGTTADPLGDADIQAEVKAAVTANGWTEDDSHMVAVFTATGIHECMAGGPPSCTFSTTKGFCAYHDHFTDGSNDAIYAFMGFDNFTHAAGQTCIAGETTGDTDPNRHTYPNSDKSADAEISTLSHEVIEAETDPHPNATWTGPQGEIGDACNYNFPPRDDTGADVYLNGHGYIVQQEWSNAAQTCAIDLPTNSYCAGSVSNVCRPTTSFAKSVDVAAPHVGSSITYTLTAHNTSDSAAETNLTLTDSPPSGYAVTAISAPGSTSNSFTASSVTVSYDTLAVHTTRTVTVTATVPQQAGTLSTNCGGLAGSDLLGTALASQTTSPCAATTPVKVPTSVTYTGQTSEDYNDVATLSAVLKDDASNPVSGKTIHFALNATETCSGVTNGAGTASCTVTPGEAAGAYTVTAAFDDATDPVYAISSTSSPFQVKLEETTTTYTGPTVILKGASGVTLKGQLLEDGATGINGRTLTLGVGGQTCNGTTNPSGVASCSVTFTGPLGSEPLSATFLGDAYYKSSSDTSKTAIVFSFPSSGAFMLGDKSVAAATPTTNLTWWADSWNGLNSLSGGGAPSSFKGFAKTITLPTTSPPVGCGSNWTSRPGDSAPPVSGIPSYMGVVVTSKVTKSGSTEVGNSVHIVVVKTKPGYTPDPTHRGTGTIVATWC